MLLPQCIENLSGLFGQANNALGHGSCAIHGHSIILERKNGASWFFGRLEVQILNGLFRDGICLSFGQGSTSAQQLWTILKVHGVKMIPLPTPDEPVLLKDPDHLDRHAVFIQIDTVGVGFGPIPIERVFDPNVYGNGKAVQAASFGPFNVTPDKCTSCLLYTSPSPRD